MNTDWEGAPRRMILPIRVNPYYCPSASRFLDKISCCGLQDFCDGGFAGKDHGSGDTLAFLCDNVSMGFGDFSDEAMCAQQGKSSGDFGACSFGFCFVGGV